MNAQENQTTASPAGTEYIRVYYTDGGLAWETESPYIAEVLPSVRTLQVNALLLVMSRHLPPMQLTCDGKGKWICGVFEYSAPPPKATKAPPTIMPKCGITFPKT